MRTKGKSTTAAQKRWMDRVASHGSVVSGASEVVLHHAAGMAASHSKVLVGPWWILPLTPEEHYNIHNDLDMFRCEVFEWQCLTRKELEKKLFKEMVERIGMNELPVEVYESIQGYRR